MFTVESVDDTVTGLCANDAELIGEVAQYDNKYKLCYMRGSAGQCVGSHPRKTSSAARINVSAAGTLIDADVALVAPCGESFWPTR